MNKIHNKNLNLFFGYLNIMDLINALKMEHIKTLVYILFVLL